MIQVICCNSGLKTKLVLLYLAIAAVSDVDYDSASMNLTFNAGDGNAAERCLRVTINPDSLIEGSEAFIVSLSLVTTDFGIAIGNTTTTTVTITDDNSKQHNQMV